MAHVSILIIEDGTNVANANSFATSDEMEAYAALRGLTVPSGHDKLEYLLVKAADYLFSLEDDFKGSRTNTTQVMPFPRDYITVFDLDISGTIPDILKQAQCRIAYDAISNDLQATGAGRVIKKEGVGPLVVEYGDDGVSDPQVNLDAALTILKPLLNSGSTATGGGININASR